MPVVLPEQGGHKELLVHHRECLAIIAPCDYVGIGWVLGLGIGYVQDVV